MQLYFLPRYFIYTFLGGILSRLLVAFSMCVFLIGALAALRMMRTQSVMNPPGHSWAQDASRVKGELCIFPRFHGFVVVFDDFDFQALAPQLLASLKVGGFDIAIPVPPVTTRDQVTPFPNSTGPGHVPVMARTLTVNSRRAGTILQYFL